MKNPYSRAAKYLMKQQLKQDLDDNNSCELDPKEILLGITTDPRGWKNPIHL